MKIVVSGKGGSGKSTVLALLARQYVAQGKSVLIIDTDESNTGLHRLLDLPAPGDILEVLGGKQAVTRKIMGAMPDPSSIRLFETPIDPGQLPAGYLSEKVSEQGHIRLVSIGKIHSFGEGCACPMGFVAKQYLSGLTVPPDEIVLVDTEAGIEHFGRGVEEGADLVVMIIDPSYESVLLAERVSNMDEISDRLVYVLNKTDKETSRRLIDRMAGQERIIGEIPLHPGIISAGLDGEGIARVPREIEEIADMLVQRYEQISHQ